MENRFVYADNSATTAVSKPVLEAMLPYLTEHYGNPSSVYSKGREAKKALDQAREKVAKALGAKTTEIFFTSCGTEADNWAIKGAAATGAKKGKKHLITTNFEHHAVLHCFETLAKEGFDVTFLPINDQGLVTAEQVKAALRPDTALVSIMYANNEIATILPINEIGKVCREAGVLFHTDAVQAVGNVNINVVEQNIDLLALSGHKIHAPKGVGALYIRTGVSIAPFMEGGAQERNRRAGTENLASIVALGTAIELACNNIEENSRHKQEIRDFVIDSILSKVSHCRLNGSREHRLPGSLNISFEGIEGESLLLMLDMKGICASSGSACTSGSLDPSHVLLALGLEHEVAHGSLRISFSEDNTLEDGKYIVEKLIPIVERLREMSPLWEKIIAAEKA